MAIRAPDGANKMLERNKKVGKVKVDPQLTSSPPQVVLVGAGGAVVDMNLGWNYIYSQTRFLLSPLFYIGCNYIKLNVVSIIISFSPFPYNPWSLL